MIWIWLWPEPKPQKERVETTDSPLGSPDNSGSDDWVFLTPSATFTATARHTAPIFLSKERTPASRVYLKKKKQQDGETSWCGNVTFLVQTNISPPPTWIFPIRNTIDSRMGTESFFTCWWRPVWFPGVCATAQVIVRAAPAVWGSDGGGLSLPSPPGCSLEQQTWEK